MTATAHALVGGAIASTIANPAIGLPLAAISHPLLDMVPHWDFGWGWKKKTKFKLFIQSITDLGLGLIVSWLIFGSRVDPIYLLLAIFFAEFWDMLEAPYWFFNWRFPPFSTIYNIQSKLQGKAKLPWGIFTQVVAVGVVVLVLQVFH